MNEMKVCVQITQYVEINHPVFDALHDIHASDVNAVGTTEQYNEAIDVIEKALSIPFFDSGVDATEHEMPRIVGVYNSWDFVPILEG